jgi:hypothetical protein
VDDDSERIKPSLVLRRALLVSATAALPLLALSDGSVVVASMGGLAGLGEVGRAGLVHFKGNRAGRAAVLGGVFSLAFLALVAGFSRAELDRTLAGGTPWRKAVSELSALVSERLGEEPMPPIFVILGLALAIPVGSVACVVETSEPQPTPKAVQLALGRAALLPGVILGLLVARYAAGGYSLRTAVYALPFSLLTTLCVVCAGGSLVLLTRWGRRLESWAEGPRA